MRRGLLWFGLALLEAGCGAQRCNPAGRLALSVPGTCTEPNTACSQHGFCEPCGQAGDLCCAGNACGADLMGAPLSCQLPDTIGALDGVCR